MNNETQILSVDNNKLIDISGLAEFLKNIRGEYIHDLLVQADSDAGIRLLYRTMSGYLSDEGQGSNNSWQTLTIPVATNTDDGVMSATDKQKLMGIAVGATNVSVTKALNSGTKIATITINGTAYDIFCQTNTNTTYTAGTDLALNGTTFNHKSSGVTANTTGKFGKYKYNAQGHITGVVDVEQTDIADLGFYTKLEVDAKISATYKPQGSVTAGQISGLSLDENKNGYVYNVNGQFKVVNSPNASATIPEVSSSLFVEGTDLNGKTFPTGTNIVLVFNENKGECQIDILSGFIDLSGYLTTSTANNTYLKKTDASNTYATKQELTNAINNINIASVADIEALFN